MRLLPLIAIFLLAACGPREGARHQDGKRADSVPAREIMDITALAETEADSLLSLMTLEEKAAQTLMPALYSSTDPYTLKAVGDYGRMGIGGVVLLKGDTASAAAIADSLQRSGRVEAFVAIDAEWGLAMRLRDAPRFPANSELSDSIGETEMFDYGEEVGRESRRLGINMVLGPVVDVASAGSFMGKRSFGSDPKRVSDLAVAYARGLESSGVMSVAKHFPGHGSARGDSHKRKPVIERSLHEMDSVDLYPFRRYIAEGLSAVMVGHLAVPAIDPEMRPAAVSKTVINDLLQTDLGFRGLVLTDALTMGGAEGNGADSALEAGADLILAPVDTRAGIAAIVKAVENGRLPAAELDRRVRKILFYKSLLRIRSGKKNTPPGAG